MDAFNKIPSASKSQGGTAEEKQSEPVEDNKLCSSSSGAKPGPVCILVLEVLFFSPFLPQMKNLKKPWWASPIMPSIWLAGNENWN
mmetsp:Transcript_45847/g.71785  ORF Transcript_45847/g.71785 Transcript_45847/m.71785 type:complete len:86 (-) Transcript_45847:23-280(-)